MELCKIKILFLIGDYGTGGKERQLTEIIRRLPKEKYEIHLFMKKNNSYYFDTIKGHLTSYYSLEKERFSILDILALKLFNKSIQPHVVFSFSSILSHYALVLKIFGLFDYRLINSSIRYAPIKLNMYVRFEKLMYNFYEEVVANSKAGLKAFNQNGKKGRYLLYNGFDESIVPINSKEELRQQLRIDERFMVVMIASMGDRKDQPTFIKAAEKVLTISDDVQFFLIGDGPKKPEYLAFVSSLQLEKNVFFTGEVDNVEEYFKASNLSVLTSASWHGEGLPNVVIESMMCGTPVIATDNGGTREILKDGINGFLVRNGDFKELSEKILLLKRDTDMAKKFVANGVRLVASRFNIEHMIHSFEGILKNSNNGKAKFKN